MNTQKSYLNYLSLARLFAIYWVVLIQHNFAPFHPDWNWIGNGEYYTQFAPLQPFTDLISMLTMPLCFFISGFVTKNSGVLSRRNEWKLYMWKKMQRLLLPCCFFGIVLQSFMQGRVGIESLMGLHHLWFIFYLFIFSIIAWWTMRKCNLRYIVLSFIVASLSYLAAKVLNIGMLYSLSIYYIWFILGLVVSHYKKRIQPYIKYTPYIYFSSLFTFTGMQYFNINSCVGG